MPEVTSVTNLLDLYQQQIVMAKNQYVVRAPLWHAIGTMTRGEVVSQRGIRYAYGKSQPGGHGNPTLSQPDNNRAIPEQTDSMWAVPQWYTIPIEIDYSLLNDAGGARGPKKAQAMFNIERIIKNVTDVAAQRQEFYACGNGSGALAYASASLTVAGAGQTLTCETAAAAAPGHTKGAVRLKQNQYYQSWDTATGLPEGTILVTSANNKTQATVTLLSGVVTSGNPITDVGSYNAVPMGITGLIDDTNRIVQGRDSAVDTIMNVPTIDLNGNKFTISDRETVKTMLVTLNLEKGARSGLTNITTPGLMSDLRKQGFGQRRLTADDAVTDIAAIYKDVDGTRMMEIANYDEDRSTFFQDNLQKFTEFEFDDINPDGLSWRNLPGVNATGSRNFYRFWGTSWTFGIDDFLTCSTIKRASSTGIVRQVDTGLGN
jgi:hypothetical protein